MPGSQDLPFDASDFERPPRRETPRPTPLEARILALEARIADLERAVTLDKVIADARGAIAELRATVRRTP